MLQAMIQVMALHQMVISHNLNQWWPRAVLPHGITRPQWVNICSAKRICVISLANFNIVILSTKDCMKSKVRKTWVSTCLTVPAGGLAPVPLNIFRSNSKFDENSERSSFKYTRPITTIFCTRHDSITVVTCAKYRCDWSNQFETRAFWIFIEFRIRSKYA